jgi:hypothetical protein
LGSSAGVKPKKTSAAEGKGTRELSGKEEINEILDGEESVLFRKKMKSFMESIGKVRSKMGL